MTILATKTCVTCCKPCYPTERLMVSDLWVHKAGCLKCSACNSTLSLSSVYVASAPKPLPGWGTGADEGNDKDDKDPNHTKRLYCAKDVPKMVHTSVVDSVALKQAMNAPNPTTTPQAVFARAKSQGKTLRFKGLTIRSKAISASLNAPKLDVYGRQHAQQVFVGHVGMGLDSWDIAHALAVQSHVSAPIKSHPAIHAQHTGKGNDPLKAQKTGQLLVEDEGDEVMSARKGEEGIKIEPDLVKNLIRVFQLDTIDAVEVIPDPLIDESPIEHQPKREDIGEGYGAGSKSDIDTNSTRGTLKPSASTLSALSTMSQCGTYRASGMGSFRGTCSIRTLGTIGSKRGTLTLARIKGTLRRPALGDLFRFPAQSIAAGMVQGEDDANSETRQVRAGTGKLEDGESLCPALLPSSVHNLNDTSIQRLSAIERPDFECVVTATPANTPVKRPFPLSSIGMRGRGGWLRMGGLDVGVDDEHDHQLDMGDESVKQSSATPRQQGSEFGTKGRPELEATFRGTKLLEALMPLATHLVPLPTDDDDDDDDDDEYHEYLHGGSEVVNREGEDGADDAEKELIKSLEMGGLELIMLFEEEIRPLTIGPGVI